MPKLQNSAQAEFWDCTPVLAFETAVCIRIQRKLNSGLWLGAFGKVWPFRCQSGIRWLWLVAFGKLGLFRCQSRSFRLSRRCMEESCLGFRLGMRFRLWNRHFDCRIQRKLNSGLWLEAFGKAGLFRCQSTFSIRFCLRHCVFLCKGIKLQNSAKPNSGDGLPVFAFASGSSCLTNSFCAGAVWTFTDGVAGFFPLFCNISLYFPVFFLSAF